MNKVSSFTEREFVGGPYGGNSFAIEEDLTERVLKVEGKDRWYPYQLQEDGKFHWDGRELTILELLKAFPGEEVPF